jgi:AcrR family transcriptional regulator
MTAADSPAPENPIELPRSRRERPAKPPLSKDAIVDVALAILKSEGLPAVTMRRVATALDTGAASLYVYVANRDALLAEMLDRVTAVVALEPPDPARWREQMHTLLGRMRESFLAYPGTAALALADPPVTGSVLIAAENLLATLSAGGFSPRDAAWSCDILVLLVQAVASEDDARRSAGGKHFISEVEELRTRLETLPPDRFPMLRTHAADMVAGDRDERFHFAIDVVLDGVLARAARAQSRRGA